MSDLTKPKKPYELQTRTSKATAYEDESTVHTIRDADGAPLLQSIWDVTSDAEAMERGYPTPGQRHEMVLEEMVWDLNHALNLDDLAFLTEFTGEFHNKIAHNDTQDRTKDEHLLRILNHITGRID